MKRITSFLSQEILWGRLAWIALIVTILAGFTFTGIHNVNPQLFYILTLAIFAIGGIIIGNIAPRHPFWNGLIFSLLCVIYAVGLLILYALGSGLPPFTGREITGTLLTFAISILPQSMAGTWIAVSFRRIRRLGEKATTGKDTPSEADTRTDRGKAARPIRKVRRKDSAEEKPQ